MLNRIYIIVGLLAIIVLAGAFIAPYFIRWSDYRGRMEELATGMLGTPVTVRGEIEFTLLPQPRLHFADVLVGSPEEPAATVDGVEAEFSLMDFLRDDYNITRLVLRQPVIDFTVDESGFFGSGVSVATGNGGVGLGQATIVDATVRLMDRRSGENFVADGVSGELRLSDFAGPFSFSGTAIYRDIDYSLRFNSGATDESGRSRVSAFLAPQSASFSMAAEGMLVPGMAPKFEGDIVYRQKPAAADVAEEISGDLVLEAKVNGSTDRIVLSGYTLRPDENRSSMRLTGAASIQLGDVRSFDAVVSGGVFALPPRDAKEDASLLPYEAVRLLAELPAPLVPPLAGRVGIDLAEIDLRGVPVRDVRVDARTDGSVWTVEQFIGQMPGDTELRASGQLTRESDRAAFRGDVSITSARLDGLAQLWRKPLDNNPLFNLPGSLTGHVMLVGDAFGLTNGVLALAERSHALEVRLGFGDEKRLDLVGNFDELDAGASAAVAALLPDIAAETAFGNSFPAGSFAFTGKSARIAGLDGSNLVATGQWDGGQVSFSRLSVEDWGGVGVDTTLTARGTLAEPTLSGSGLLRVGAAGAPALQRLYDVVQVPGSWRDYLGLSMPAELLVNLSEPVENSQTVTLSGAFGAGNLNLRAELSGGIAGLATAPLRVSGGLESADVDALTRQLGLGETQLFASDGSMLVSLSLEGVPNNSLVTTVTASLDDENVSFSGSMLARGEDIEGTGTLDVNLADAGAIAGAVGVSGLSLPAINGSAQLHFEGSRLVRLSDIAGTSAEVGFAGALSLTRSGSTAAVDGDVSIDALSVEGLAAALLSPEALIGINDVWPEGPLGANTRARQTRGAVSVTAASLQAAGVERFGSTSFELNWDETRTRLAGFKSVAGAGTLGLDIAVCCAGPLVERTITGRVTLAGMPIDTVAPPVLADSLDGAIDGGAQFEGTGASLAELLTTLSGEGNFTVTGLSAAQLSPTVFRTVAGLEDILDMDPDAMGAIMNVALGQGPFAAPTATGAFTIAGGVVRLANLIIEGEGANVSGNVNLAMTSLGLNGSFVMTPRDFEDAGGIVGPDTSRIITRVAGTLLAPEITPDLEEMIAAVLVRANELEVDRLEVLRAEDAERQRVAAEERNRLIAEQRRKAAEAAAKLATEEAARQALDDAARLAEENEARRLEQLQLQLQPPVTSPSIQTVPPPTFTAPLDLGLQPQVNQPVGPGVNQRF